MLGAMVSNARKRPATAAALLGSVVWIAVVVIEVQFRLKSEGGIGFSTGEFFRLAEIVQLSGVGVLGLAALAWMFERVWGSPTPDAVLHRDGRATEDRPDREI